MKTAALQEFQEHFMTLGENERQAFIDLTHDEGNIIHVSAQQQSLLESINKVKEAYELIFSETLRQEKMIREIESKGGFATIEDEIIYNETMRLLDPTNFRIDSEGWMEMFNGQVHFKINPEKDIIEVLEGEFRGEQKFTQAAAIRETAKAGKRIPSNEEWESMNLKINPGYILDSSGSKIKRLPGLASIDDEDKDNPRILVEWQKGEQGIFWSSDNDYALVLRRKSFPSVCHTKFFLCSVRCLKDQ